MNDLELSNIYEIVTEKLKARIEQTKGRLEDKMEKLNNPSKEKITGLSKFTINLDIKNYKEEIANLEKFQTSFFDLRFDNNKQYSLPESLKGQFDELGSLLSNQETEKLAAHINECLKKTREEKNEKMNQNIKNIEKLLKKPELKKYEITVNGKLTPLESVITKIKHQHNSATSYVYIKKDSREVEISQNDQTLLSSLETMIKNKKIEQNKNMLSIAENFDAIKEAFITKNRLSQVLVKLSQTKDKLGKIEEVDFTKTIDFLKRIEKNCMEENEKINKFLSKFDFDIVKKQIEEEREQEEIEKYKDTKVFDYQNLAYDLEKYMTENPNEYEKIQQIKEAMRELALEINMPNDKIEEIALEGKTNYQKDQQEAKAKVTKAKEKIAYEDQLKSDVMIQMREYAIRELESANAFEDGNEVRNNDVYSKPVNKEEMIQRKIEELKKLVDMTPEQRGLEDQKKRGNIRSTDTLEDLTSQQINDMRIAYSDESYGFIADYKNYRSREEKKPMANSIYKEYIKYRASLEDKADFLSFSDYSKQVHNLDGMSEIMVDEELKNEIKVGSSR